MLNGGLGLVPSASTPTFWAGETFKKPAKTGQNRPIIPDASFEARLRPMRSPHAQPPGCRSRNARFELEVEAYRRSVLDRAVGLMARRATWATNGIAKLARGAKSESVRLAVLRSILSDMMSVSDFAVLEQRGENRCQFVFQGNGGEQRCSSYFEEMELTPISPQFSPSAPGRRRPGEERIRTDFGVPVLFSRLYDLRLLVGPLLWSAQYLQKKFLEKILSPFWK